MATMTGASRAQLRLAVLTFRENRRRSLVGMLVLVGASGVAGLAGYVLKAGGAATAVVWALGMAGVLLLGYLALSRFEWFIWIVLLTRPVLDLLKPERGSGGSSSGQLATVMGAAVIVGGLVWVAAVSREGRRLPMSVVSRALILLTVASLVSVGHSAQPMTSVLQVARTTGAVVLFVVLEQLLRTRQLAARTLLVCALSTLVPLGVGVVQIATGGGSTRDGLARVTGSFLHPNTFGLFLVLVLLMGYAVRRHVAGGARRLLDVLLVLCIVELLFTYSRGSWIVLAGGLLVLAVLAERRLFLILPIALVAIYVLFPSVVTRFVDLGATDTVSGRPGNSASWRLAHLEDLLGASNGWSLFGIGPKMSEQLTVGGEPPHNDAIRLFVENGIVGLVFYLMFLVGLVLVARRALRRLRTGFDRGLAVGYAAVVVAFLLDSMGANLITQFVLLIYVLALTAVVQAWVNTADPPDRPSRAAGPPVVGGESSESAHVRSGAGRMDGHDHGDS